jgi:hypothetical protein
VHHVAQDFREVIQEVIPRCSMTKNEQELVDALEADIQRDERIAQYFATKVSEIETISGRMSGKEQAALILARIRENRELIERVKNSK